MKYGVFMGLRLRIWPMGTLTFSILRGLPERETYIPKTNILCTPNVLLLLILTI